MSRIYLTTSDIANEIGIHANTVRLYEAEGFIPAIPRKENGYRQFNIVHLEQARLAYLTLHWPWVGDKTLLINLVTCSAKSDFDMAMEFAYKYLARIRVEITEVEAAINFLERWAKGQRPVTAHGEMLIGEVAQHLNVTVDMLRNWERNGLINVPRHPLNNYRLYSSKELGRLRVIHTLIQSGFSMMAILTMLNQFDAGQTENLSYILELPSDASINEYIEVIADRRLSSLQQLDKRAKSIIKQLNKLIEMTHNL